MAVDPKIDELLKRLAETKGLPAASQPFRTQQAQVGSQVRDAAGRAFASTPRLSDAVQQIQQGGVAQTGAGGTLARVLGSPIGKVALGGLNAIDMPRRAIISGLKELNDYIDIDPNTKASFGDLRTQFNDPSFGFGRVAPMEGWKGRIVGFIGDVALDPLTYLTVGGTVPVKAIARGAGAAGLRATAKVGAQDVALRVALGTKNVTGREGRFALANLVRQYGGTVDEVAAVASRGKSAVPADIAKVMGLQRNGLYMFGSRVRLPGSGFIGGALETGLVKARLGLTNTNVGKKLQYLYTPRGASGTYGDLSKVRADLASGRLPKDKVDLVFAGLKGAENGRSRGASYGQQYLRDAGVVARNEYVQNFDSQIHKFIETADPTSLSPDQRKAVALVQDHWERVRVLLEMEGQKIDPDFKLNVGAVDPTTGRPRYIPHVQTEEMYRWRQKNSTHPFAKLLDEQTSVDVLDMNNNLASRFFKVGDKFMETEDVIKYGTIEELNELWRRHSKTNFDMFETSTQRILAGYEQTVRGAIEAFSLIDELKNSDFVRLLRAQGEIDPDYLKSLEKLATNKTKNVVNLTASARAAADELVSVVRQTFDTNYRRSIASSVQRAIPGVRAEIRTTEGAIAQGLEAASRADALSKQLVSLVEKQQAEAVSLAALFEEKNLVMTFMNDALQRSYDEALGLDRQVRNVRGVIEQRTASAEQAQAALDLMEEKAKDAAAAFKRAEETLDYYRLYGDELGPALQNIYERIRLADSTADGVLSEPEVYRVLESDISEGLFSGDERVNNVLNILMRPFDATPIQNSTDLGQKWLSDAINNPGDVGKLLGSIADVGSPKGTRATRAQMAKSGKGGRRLTGAQVNDIIGRASTVGDNHAEMADAFYFMTARELRAAHDAVGGGAEGLAAQQALAKELLAGTTERAKLWTEANKAVSYVKEQMDIIRTLGSKRVQRGGKYLDHSETIEALERINVQIENFQDAIPDSAITAYNNAKDAVDEFTSVNQIFGTTHFIDKAFESMGIFLNNMGIIRPELQTLGEFRTFETAIRVSKKKIGEGVIPPREGVQELFNQMDAFFRKEFKNSKSFKNLQAKKAELERAAAAALKMDKQFTDVSSNMLASTIDAGIKLANYHILHATRLSLDAIAVLTPSNTAPSEALFAFARSGAARQQLKHLTNFQDTVYMAERVMEKIRDQVFGGVLYSGEAREAGTKVADRALVLRQAVQSLPDDEREALYAVVGDLSYVEKQIATGTKMEVARRTTQEYANIRDRIWNISTDGVDWRTQIEIDVPYYLRTGSRARTYRYADDSARFAEPESYSNQRRVYDENGNFVGYEYGGEVEIAASAEAQAKEAKNRVNRMENATPKALNKEIDRLYEVGKITQSEADELRRGVASAEEAAKKTQMAARERAKATGKGERAAKQRARGIITSADETFGTSRAFWFATRLNADGSTLSNRRVLDFFTMIFGDGEVRVSNSGGWKRPQQVLEGDEIAYREQAQKVISAAKAEKKAAVERLPKAMRAEAKSEAIREINLNYWRTLGNDENRLVDIAAVERIYAEIDSARTEIRFLKAKVESEPLGSYARNSAERSVERSQAKLKSLNSQLNAIERDATQLVQRGTSSPEATFKYIPVSESVLGRAGMRTRLRIEALRTLARDPEAATAFNLTTGINRNEVLTGTFGLVEFLRGRANELEAAVAAGDAAAGKLEKLGRRVERSSAVNKQGYQEAQQIAENPSLGKRVDAAINSVSKDAGVRSKARRDLVRSKQWTAKEGPLPPRTAKIVNEQRNIVQQLGEIEKSPEYTTALEREFNHKVLMELANLDMSDPKIRFPESIFDDRTIGALKAFAGRGQGVKDGLDPSSSVVNSMLEISLDDVVNEVLQGKAKNKYVFLLGNQRITDSIVRDVLLKRNNSRFRYLVTQTEPDGSGVRRLVYQDKALGSVTHNFNEVAPEGFVPSEIVLEDPIYLSKVSNEQTRQGGTFNVADKLAEQYYGALEGNLSTFKKGDRIVAGGDANSFFDYDSAYVSYASPTGERVYRMRDIIGVRQEAAMYPGGNPLDPQNLFDESKGRGIIKGFNSLFEEPAAPLSAKGKKLRADLQAKQVERNKVVANHAKQLDAMRSAKTDGAYRAAQQRAANLSEEIATLDAELDVLARRVDDANPVTQMVTVENVGRVIEYLKSNPDLLRRLGVKIDGETVSDGDVLKGIKKYVEALQYQKINPVKRGTKLTGRPLRSGEALRYEGKAGERRLVSNEVDKPVSILSASEVSRRRRNLNRIFNDSPQGKLIADVRKKNERLAANQKELVTIRSGGPAAELVAAERATREELARAERLANLNAKELGKALRKQKPKVEPLPGETAVETARRVAADEEKRLSALPLAGFASSISDEARQAAQRAAGAAEGVASWYEGAAGGIVDSLKAIDADISARESIIKSLRERESEVNDRIAVIYRMLKNEKIAANQREVMTDELRSLHLQLHGVQRTPTRPAEKGLNQQINDSLKAIDTIQKQRKTIEAKLVQERSAVDPVWPLSLTLDDARKRLDLLNVTMEDIKGIRSRASVSKKDGWMAEFDEFAAEVSDVVTRLNTMEDGPDTKRLAGVLTGYLEAKANMLRATAEAGTAAADAVAGQLFGPRSHIVIGRVLDEGWEQLTGSGALSTFTNLQMRPEVAEILKNMGRMRDPVFVKSMRIWFGPYTRFFKAWALSTPGYHVRNTVTNAFMLVAAGGRPAYLAEGMREYNSLYRALKNGVSIDQYLASLPDARRATVADAYKSMLGSGVGQSEEIAFETGGVLTNNPFTRANKRVGSFVEQHSRFMLSYDGIKQGLDVNGATARTRKFLFDYEDVSTLDAYARSIVPFWMWTSRNLPLTIQNIYMNPRPYQWYQSLRRNVEDEEKTKGLPLYMREAGGFALAGTNLAATPDLGFNRLQADVNMVTSPTRFAANVNPLLRVPVETMLANKSFFRNRQFQQQPLPVEGPVGTLASLLGQPIGAGGSVGGQRFVDEKLLYALGNLIPTLNQVERFIPSQEYYQQRGTTNPLLGYLGAPVREVTPQMTVSEQKRILAEIAKLQRAQPKVGEQ